MSYPLAVVEPIDLVTLTREEYAELLAAKADRDTVEKDARDAMHMLWLVVRGVGGEVKIKEYDMVETNWRKASIETFTHYDDHSLTIRAVGP